MDLYRIIDELGEERDRIHRLIESLERGRDALPTRASPLQRRRGRRSMDGAGRQQVSERMKLYWAKRRGEVA
jgi:hypothetical protein